MGDLYNICQRLMQEIETRNPQPIEQVRLKGRVAAKTGFMVSLVSPRDADDPVKIAVVRQAAQEIGITL